VENGLGWGAFFGAVKVAVVPHKSWAFSIVAVFKPLAGRSDFMYSWHVVVFIHKFAG
jgi:hypothetical protein